MHKYRQWFLYLNYKISTSYMGRIALYRFISKNTENSSVKFV